MKTRYAVIALVGLALCVASAAFAAKSAQPETVAPLGVPACDVTGYKVETQVLSPRYDIPDAASAVVAAGVIPTPDDGDVMHDVRVEATMAHTWVGDLVLRVSYGPCAGGPALASADLLCRQRGTGTTIPAPCGTGTGFGASANLGAAGVDPSGELPYLFGADAATQIANGDNPTAVPAGCYLPVTGLIVFDGLSKGGCFTLSVGDYAGGDTGYITEWKVYLQNQGPVATSSRTWGQLKTTYR